MIQLRDVITVAINSVSIDGMVVEHTSEELVDEIMTEVKLAGIPIEFPFD